MQLTNLGVVFQLGFASDFFNLQLVRFHQSGMFIEKYLIQRRNFWVGVKPLTLRSWSSQKRRSEPPAHHSADGTSALLSRLLPPKIPTRIIFFIVA